MSDSVRPHRWQGPLSLGFSRQEHWSGLPFPSPMRESEVAQSCPTLSDPMDCSLPGSSIHEIFQARVLEWVAIAFSGSLGYPLQYSWVSLVVQMVKNLPTMRETWVQFLNWEDSPGGGHGNPLQYCCLENSMDREAWWPQGSHKEVDTTVTRHTHSADHTPVC